MQDTPEWLVPGAHVFLGCHSQKESHRAKHFLSTDSALEALGHAKSKWWMRQPWWVHMCSLVFKGDKGHGNAL